MAAAQWPASWGWLACSALGAVPILPVWRVLEPTADPAPAPAATTQHGPPRLDLRTWAITAIFGLAGFGYIIIARFLPVIVRHAMPGSPWVDLFWPIFGAGVAVGAWLVTRIALHRNNMRMLAILYVAQAAGVGIGAA